jgi:dTDP-glucose 4,6-dehydratase
VKLIVTGGAGFIGSAFVRLVLGRDADARITVVDKLTYAGNLENLEPVAGHKGYKFVRGDIADLRAVSDVVAAEAPDAIVHFAAESHVDRSILSPGEFFETNLRGTFCLLEAARAHKVPRFAHVSTDEVYGSIDEPHEADEEYPLHTSSPYSAAKAGSDLLAKSYFHTYKLPVVITRASNNYGPYQFPEKLIPLMVNNALDGGRLPIYGDGMQVRDWLYVDDHCRGIEAALLKGRDGEIYNIGGNCSLPNREVVDRIIAATGASRDQIDYVADRPGHDRRYALTNAKLTRETGWEPQMGFDQGLAETVAWYRANRDWVARVRSGEYKQYYERNYGSRGQAGAGGGK